MLRWTTGMTRHDHIRNEDIDDRFGIASIAEKLLETHFRWYGHVIGTSANSLVKIGLKIEVNEKRPKGWPMIC